MTTPSKAVTSAGRMSAFDGRSPLLIALDLDGTLVPSRGEVPETTVRAVAGAQDAGHHIVIATGRSLVGVPPIVRRLGLREGWVVASNGAVVARITRRHSLLLEDMQTFDPTTAVRKVWRRDQTRWSPSRSSDRMAGQPALRARAAQRAATGRARAGPVGAAHHARSSSGRRRDRSARRHPIHGRDHHPCRDRLDRSHRRWTLQGSARSRRFTKCARRRPRSNARHRRRHERHRAPDLGRTQSSDGPRTWCAQGCRRRGHGDHRRAGAATVLRSLAVPR